MGFLDFIRNFSKQLNKQEDVVIGGGGVIGGNSLEHETPRIDGLDYLDKDNVDLDKLYSYLTYGELVAEKVDDRRVSLSINLSVSETRYLRYSYVFFNSEKYNDFIITAYKELYEKIGDGVDSQIDGFSKTISRESLDKLDYSSQVRCCFGAKQVTMNFGNNELILYCKEDGLDIDCAIFNNTIVFGKDPSGRPRWENPSEIRSSKPIELEPVELNPSESVNSDSLKNTSIFGN